MRTEDKIQTLVKKIPFYSAILVMTISILALIGWEFDVEFLKRPAPRLVGMNPTSAVAFILSGISLLLLAKAEKKLSSGAPKFVAAIVAAIGAFRFGEVITHLYIGADQIFYPDKLITDAARNISNRIGPNTALSFFLLGAVLLLSCYESRRRKKLANVLAFIIMTTGLFSFLAYLYRVSEFYSILSYYPMSVQSALCFMLMGFAILCFNNKSGFMRTFTSPYAGGEVARKLIPPVVFIPAILGLIRLWISWLHPFSTELGVAALITCIVGILFILTWYLATILNKSDAARTVVQEELKDLNQNLENKITERTEKLVSTEKQFRHTLENMLEGIQIIDFTWTYIYVNDALVKYSTYSREELIGYTIMEKYPGVEQTDLFSSLQRCMNERVPEHLETEFAFPNGTKGYFELSIQPIPEGIFILSVDISEQRKAKEKIRKANRLYAFLSAINQSIVHINNEDDLLDKACEVAASFGEFKMAWIGMVDENNRLRMVNLRGDNTTTRDVQKYSGLDYTKAELVNTPTGRMLSTGKYAISNDVLNDPAMLPWRKEMLHHGIKANVTLPIKKFGRVVGAFGLNSTVENFFDADEIALLEEAAGDISFALENFEKEKMRSESERRYRHLFYDNPMPSWIIDINSYKFLDVNNSAIEQYGYSKEEFLSMTALDLRPDNEKDRFLKLNRSFTDEVQKGGIWIHIKKDGTSIYVEISSSDMVFEGTSARLILANNVTEKKKAADEIKELNEHLEERVNERVADLTEANKALEAFSSTVSHDLRAPARAIKSFADIILQDYGDKMSPKEKELFGYIEASGKRMNAIIDDLLRLAKYGSEKLKLEPVDMARLVNGIWLNISRTTEHHASLVLKELPTVQADMSMIQQVVVNLFSNAIKYSSKKDKPAVTVSCEQSNESATFYFRDNGAGFDMKNYERLFGAFQRLHTTRDFEGTGVGLSLVKRIIEKHGGTVGAEAKVDEGAVFYFTLPLNTGSNRD